MAKISVCLINNIKRFIVTSRVSVCIVSGSIPCCIMTSYVRATELVCRMLRYFQARHSIILASHQDRLCPRFHGEPNTLYHGLELLPFPWYVLGRYPYMQGQCLKYKWDRRGPDRWLMHDCSYKIEYHQALIWLRIDFCQCRYPTFLCTGHPLVTHNPTTRDYVP
jgi:hypothetical protein